MWVMNIFLEAMFSSVTKARRLYNMAYTSANVAIKSVM